MNAKKVLTLLVALLLCFQTYALSTTPQIDEALYEQTLNLFDSCMKDQSMKKCEEVISSIEKIESEVPESPFLWTFEAEDSNIRGVIYNDGGLIYVATGENIYTLEEESGEVIRTMPLKKHRDVRVPEPFEGIIIFDEDVSGSELSNNENDEPADASLLYAVDLYEQKKRWELTLTTSTYPEIYKNVVYIPQEESLYAVDIQTGETLWLFESDQTVEDVITGLDSVTLIRTKNHRPIGISSDEKEPERLFAINSNNGNVLWKVELDDEEWKYPVVANDMVLLSSSTELYALDENDGHTIWKNNNHIYDITIFDGKIAGFQYSKNEGLFLKEIDLESGNLEWTVNIDGDDSSLEFYGNSLYLSSSPEYKSPEGGLYQFDSRTGVKKWELKTDSRLSSRHAFSSDAIYVSDYQKTLYAISAATGKAIWKSAGAGEPYLIGDALYSVSNASISLINRETGAVLWEQRSDTSKYWDSEIQVHNNLMLNIANHSIETLKNDLYSGPYQSDLYLMKSKAYSRLGNRTMALQILDKIEAAKFNIRDALLARIDICEEAEDVSCVVNTATEFIVDYPGDSKIEFVKNILKQLSPFEWDFHIGSYDWSYDAVFTVDSDDIIINKGRRDCLTGRITSFLQVYDRYTGNSLWKKHMFSGYIEQDRVSKGTLVFDALNKCHWINILTGEINWTFEPEDGYWYWGSFVEGEDVFLTAKSSKQQNGRIYCIDYSTHRIKWIYDLTNVENIFNIIEVLNDKALIYQDIREERSGDDEISFLETQYTKEQIRAVSRVTGEVLWETEELHRIDIRDGIFLEDVFVVPQQHEVSESDCEEIKERYPDEEVKDGETDEDTESILQSLEQTNQFNERCFKTTLNAYDTHNGKMMWVFETGYLYKLLNGDDGIIVISQGAIQKLSKETGEELLKKEY